MGEKKPGAEHLVLAALDLQEGSARRVFERVHADPGAFRSAIVDQHADAARAVGVEPMDDVLEQQIRESSPSLSPMRSSRSARELFKKVVELVRKEKSHLSGAYIVLVASQVEHGTTARALRSMGIDPVAFIAASRSEIDVMNAGR
ncbi:MAG: hypothetical protein BMS9Abin12_1624 [Acidimicrobiia bacterium]|nr:MAG: hypothetical protein BMS9Abin12_1624 [Acidimicrobiia bacterium]